MLISGSGMSASAVACGSTRGGVEGAADVVVEVRGFLEGTMFASSSMLLRVLASSDFSTFPSHNMVASLMAISWILVCSASEPFSENWQIWDFASKMQMRSWRSTFFLM